MQDAEPLTPTAPRPAGRTVFTQGWRDVAFLHWRVDPGDVAPLLPPGTRPDLHDGSSWVGLIPFRMRRGAGRGRGAPPPASSCAPGRRSPAPARSSTS